MLHPSNFLVSFRTHTQSWLSGSLYSLIQLLGGSPFPREASIGSDRYSLTTKAAATLGAGDLEAAVKVPPGADEYEWIAVKTLDIFNEINLLLGAISDFCKLPASIMVVV